MDERKRSNLVKIFGEEMAEAVILAAETKTKEIEDSGVRFKVDKEAVDPVEVVAVVTPTAAVEPGVSDEAILALGAAVQNLTSMVGTMAESMKAVQDQVKDLQKSDDEKMAALAAPRITPAMTRPTEQTANVTDTDGKKITGDGDDENPFTNHPARGFVDDLIRASRNGSTT